jgi:hypothetical protein
VSRGMSLLVPVPPVWANPTIALFHGTLDVHALSLVTSGVNVALGRRYRDFGRGFYTTTLEQQARSWASQLAEQFPRSAPAIVRFDVDRDALARLDCLWFVRGGFDVEDYWSLVFHCRQGLAAHGRATKRGWYDIVVGPVTASWRTRLIFHDTDQISFHTPRAAKVLNASNPRVLP